MMEATTIVAVRRNGQCAVAGDGQVTFGQNTIMKHNAKKVRRLYNDKVVVGFAGSVADAFTLCERFEALGGRVTVDGSDGFRVTARVPAP